MPRRLAFYVHREDARKPLISFLGKPCRYTDRCIILDPKDGESKMEGSLTYQSSQGVFRESCGKCGAAIFYWNYSREADVLGVAAGLTIDEGQLEDGARAER